MAKTVYVDRDACISCGLCISIAPSVFQFVDNKSQVVDPCGAPEQTIQECIDGCPVAAIRWEEDDEG